jgi:hypothetical protein
MPRKAKADMTLAQKNTLELNKFRKQAYNQALEEARVAPINDDYAKFKRDSYREALREAKAAK